MTAPDALRIAPIAKADEAAGLELLWPEMDDAERLRRREAILAPAAAPAPLWGAYRGDRLVGAMRVEAQPGRTATITPPRMLSAEPSSTAQQLLSAVLAELKRQDLRIVQALLPAGASPEADMLAAAGVTHLADLLYLVSLLPAPASGIAAAELQWKPYREQERADWQQLIARTYVGSLDCPGAEGLRGMDDVLDAYQATGVFDPGRWLWASHAGRDVGCLLLADDPAQSQWEVTYLGVVPEARGRGWGLAFIRHAQWLAQRAGRQRLVLAVDASNGPALVVYEQAGFLHWDRRSVYLGAL